MHEHSECLSRSRTVITTVFLALQHGLVFGIVRWVFLIDLCGDMSVGKEEEMASNLLAQQPSSL